MTDETETKKMWTRCPACSTVMPNIQIAKDGHKLNCPHDTRLKIQALEEIIEGLRGQLSGVNGHVESLAAEPSVDLAGVADWDDEEDETEHITVQTSSIPVQVPRIPNPFDEDDEDDLR